MKTTLWPGRGRGTVGPLGSGSGGGGAGAGVGAVAAATVVLLTVDVSHASPVGLVVSLHELVLTTNATLGSLT